MGQNSVHEIAEKLSILSNILERTHRLVKLDSFHNSTKTLFSNFHNSYWKSSKAQHVHSRWKSMHMGINSNPVQKFSAYYFIWLVGKYLVVSTVMWVYMSNVLSCTETNQCAASCILLYPSIVHAFGWSRTWKHYEVMLGFAFFKNVSKNFQKWTQ